MATIGTQVEQAYTPQSQFVPLDYRTLMSSVQTLRDRYDRSMANLTALERVKSQVDVGGNESGKMILDEVFGEVDKDLKQYTSSNVNMIDAEHAINQRAMQMIGDPRMQALLESQQNRQLAQQRMMELGEGNYYNFNPYEQHNFYDAEGKIQRYTPDVAEIGDRATVMNKLMANIAPDTIKNLGLTDAEVKGLTEWHRTGTIEGITEDKIRSVAQAQLEAYRDNTQEGRVHNRILRHQGMEQQDIDNLLVEELFNAGKKQKSWRDNTQYVRGGTRQAPSSGGFGFFAQGGLTSPAHGSLVNLIQNKSATFSKEDVEQLGLDKVDGPVYVGDFTRFDNPETAAAQMKDMDILRSFNTSLENADSNLLGQLRMWVGDISESKSIEESIKRRTIGREVGKEEKEGFARAVQQVDTFFERYPEGIKVGNATIKREDFNFLDPKKIDNSNYFEELKKLRNFNKAARSFVKQRYSISDNDLRKQEIVGKLDLSEGTFEPSTSDNNAQIIGNFSNSTNEAVVQGYVRIPAEQLEKQWDDDISEIPGAKRSAPRSGDADTDYWLIPVTKPLPQIDNRSTGLREANRYFKDPQEAQASWNTVQSALADATYREYLESFVRKAFKGESDEQLKKRIQVAHARLEGLSMEAAKNNQRFMFGYGDVKAMEEFYTKYPELFNIETSSG